MIECEANLSTFARWWIYQKERFPVSRFTPLVAAFSFCSLCLSRLMRGELSWPNLATALTAFVCVFLFFLQLRFLDEFKDREVDAKYRPYRPVPRGLISLREIGFACMLTALIQAGLAFWLYPPLIILQVAVWLYMALMTVEFFVPEWLKPRLFTYMWTHMLIMPIIDLFSTGCDWLLTSRFPPTGLLLFLLASFFNGILIELGRKTWAPVQESIGVDSYSSYWGLGRALRFFRGTLVLSFICVIGVGLQVNFFLPALTVMGLLLLSGWVLTLRFDRARDVAHAKKLENFSGYWVTISYLMQGIIPVGSMLWMR